MPTFSGEDWTVDELHQFWDAINELAFRKWPTITYNQPQIELVSADQMVEIIATIGSPCSYDHWSIGKSAISLKKQYAAGKSGLALELIINSNPPVMYIMENNTLIQQGLVLAHAGVGHGSVFKNNYLFKQWTDADSILDYMTFARAFVAQCELDHGPTAVEELLDVCHSLDIYGVTHHKRNRKKKVKQQLETMIEERQTYDNNLLNQRYKKRLGLRIKQLKNDKIQLPEENLLYFIEKYSDILKPWQKEIIHINRKLAEYFYPQRKTKIIHEGWASFMQMRIFEELYNEGTITEGGYIEFLRNHVNVCFQPDHDHKYYNGQLNPYAVGLQIFQDLYRMTKEPTDADRLEYPEICDTNWSFSLMDIVNNYSDSDFIARYLTPTVIHNLRLFNVHSSPFSHWDTIDTTADTIDRIREIYSDHLNIFTHIPRLEVTTYSTTSKRIQVTAHCVPETYPDWKSLEELGYYLHKLWGHEVNIVAVDHNGEEIT